MGRKRPHGYSQPHVSHQTRRQSDGPGSEARFQPAGVSAKPAILSQRAAWAINLSAVPWQRAWGDSASFFGHSFQTDIEGHVLAAEINFGLALQSIVLKREGIVDSDVAIRRLKLSLGFDLV